MADLNVEVEESKPQDQEQEQEQSPLLIADQTHQHQQQENQEHRGEDDHDTHLDKTLQRLDSLLTLLGFNQSSVFSFGLSCVVFLLIGVSLPVVVLVLSDCSNCEEYQIKAFEIDVVVSQAFLAAASLLCLSHNLRKYGIRKFLFVDRYSGHVERFANEYNQKICVSCIEYSLFSPYWKETQCIRHDVLEMVSGEYSQVSSVVQVVGILLCLNAAAKISHRAQGIASLASRWHALVTCSSSDTSQLLASHSMENMEALLHMNNSENDLESLNFVAVPTNTQLASYMSSYHKRQALVMYLQTNPGGITIFGWTVDRVMYLQTNPGGITIFGWTVDRGLINTIFFIELSLVLFVFGKTVVFASE
ncbi:unnamed protein product [Ilex paraguariensis]|uniref:Uncharacterized protein n=1 Tax=Ilex paraguariensis TaxID=185542 RepID=A0ABC8SFW7_9AQUA